MISSMKNKGAQYLDSSAFDLRGSTRRTKKIRSFSFRKLFLQSTVVLMALMVLGTSLQITAIADIVKNSYAVDKPSVDDTEDGSSKISSTVKSAMEAEGFDPTKDEDVTKWAKKTSSEPANKNSFSYLFYRILTPQYINQTPKGMSVTGSGRTAGCNAPNTGYGTVVYHNCDVPNFVGEVSQDIVRFLIPSGLYGATQESAKSLNSNFGFPTGVLPGDKTVPVNENSRSYKYTGLELFGYNVRYSTYLGEWDYIKVFTDARAMSNFGTFDKIKLGGKAILDGAFSAAGNAVEGYNSGKEKGFWSAIGGFFSGIYTSGESGVTSAVNTILDTSDLNVFEQKAWYRPDFGATTYGARQLNSEELSAEALKQMNAMMNSYSPKTAAIPADFPANSSGPSKPLEAISSCDIVSDLQGGTTAWGQRSSAPGVSAADCKAQGDSAKAALIASLNDENKDDDQKEADKRLPIHNAASHKHNPEGVRAQESISSWSATNASWISGMDKYNFSCTLPPEGSMTARAPGINAWYKCLSDKYAGIYDKTLTDEKKKENDKYANAMFGNIASLFAGFFAAANQDQNFSAAYNRFVCQDPKTGKDIMNGAVRAKVYKKDGTLTGSCSAIRPPIQDGLFGNGYTNGQATPHTDVDTRRTQFSPMESLWSAVANTVANGSLGISSSVTRFSNTILGLAFTPILDALGLRDTIVGLIESFRDSMFMPLAGLMAALGAISILWKAIRSGAYASGLTSFLYIVVAFMVAVIVLARPAMTLKAIDEAPVMIENTILSALFGDGADDDLCTVSGSPTGSTAGGKTIDGGTGFNPNMSTRVLMCENWRAFVFTPWVYGQWGTGWENLYAKGYGAGTGTKTFNNTNQALVGNAAVNFGNGKTIRNWATYQLSTMTTGTSTTADSSKPTGIVNKNFYRLVDLQMGPNGGAGTDATYASAWSKTNGDTGAAIVMAPISAVMGAIVVIGYSLAKIELVITSILLLTILPLMLLLGIHPTFGRQKLKAYAGTLVGLMIQRIMLTVLLGFLFKFLFAASAVGTNYLLVAVFTIIISALFIGYRKELLGIVQKAMDETAGSFAGGALYDARSKVAEHIPVGVKNFASMRRQEAKGMAYGAAAGVLHGQVPMGTEMRHSLKNIRDTYRQRESGSQLTRGLAGSQKASKIKNSVDAQLNEKFNGAEYNEARNRITEEAGGFERNPDGSIREEQVLDEKGQPVLEIVRNADGTVARNADGTIQKIAKTVQIKKDAARTDSNGNFLKEVAVRNAFGVKERDEDGNVITKDAVRRDKIGRRKTLQSTALRKSMTSQNKIAERISKLEEKKISRVAKGEQRALRKMGYSDNTEDMSNEQRTEYEINRARVHMELTRWSREDNRSEDRRGSKIERDIQSAKDSLDSNVESTVKDGRLRDSENLRGERQLAYRELATQIDNTWQSLKDASQPARDRMADNRQERAWSRDGRRLLRDIDRTSGNNQSERGGENL